MTSSEKDGLNTRKNASPKWDRTRPGVRRSKRHLLASRTRCKCPMETSWDKVKTSKTVIRSSSVTMSLLGKCLINGGVTVYDHVPEGHVTFGRGELHNARQDPHFDHRTSLETISNVHLLPQIHQLGTFKRHNELNK